MGTGVIATLSMVTINADGDLTKTGTGTLQLGKVGSDQIKFTGSSTAQSDVTAVQSVAPLTTLALGSTLKA